MNDFGICMAHSNLRSIYFIALYDFLVQFKERGFDFENEFKEKYKDHPMGGGEIAGGVFDLSGLPQVAEWERKYIPADKLNKYDSSLGLYDPRTRGQKSA